MLLIFFASAGVDITFGSIVFFGTALTVDDDFAPFRTFSGAEMGSSDDCCAEDCSAAICSSSAPKKDDVSTEAPAKNEKKRKSKFWTKTKNVICWR